MTTFPELVRSRATQIAEIRRTGRQDLADNLLKDLFLISEGIETGRPAQDIADMLSDALAVTAPAPRPDVSVYPYLATFRGQGEMLGQIVDLDDRFSYPVSEDEATEAAGAEGLLDAVEFDALSDAAAAPAEVKNWSGPFEIGLTHRAYRIESDHAGSVPLYADTLEDLRALLVQLFTEDAETYEVAFAEPLRHEIEAIDEASMTRAGGVLALTGMGVTQRITRQDPALDIAEDDSIFDLPKAG